MLIVNKTIYKYSILQYNFNNYELLYDPPVIDPYCEYIYVTDNSTLKSNIWKIIIDKDLNKLNGFDKCYAVRYNLFKYCSTNICIYLDGSIKIAKPLTCIYNLFKNSNADIGLNIHPSNNMINYEYDAWINRYLHEEGLNGINGITLETIIKEKERVLNFMISANYDFNYKGLYQGTMRICKNTELNHNIDSLVLKYQHKLGQNNNCARVTQTIYSFVLNKFFNYINVFPFDCTYFHNEYMYHYFHNSTTIKHILPKQKNYYLFNKQVYINSYDEILFNKYNN